MSDELKKSSESSLQTESENTDKQNTEITAADDTPKIPPHKAYAKRTLQFRTYYFQLVLSVAVLSAIAVAMAVAFNVVIGATIAVAAAVIYAVFTSDDMYKKLGFKYTSIPGGIKITEGRVRYGDVIWVPSNLIGLDIIEIQDKAFKSEKNETLSCVFLPATLKTVGEDIFEGCTSLTDIHFEGSEEEWLKIESKTDFSSFHIRFGAKYPPIPKKKKKDKKIKFKK